MPYIMDRRHVLWTRHLVVLLSVRTRRVRTQVVSADNSLYRTLTRTKTLVRRARHAAASGLIVTDARTQHHLYRQA